MPPAHAQRNEFPAFPYAIIHGARYRQTPMILANARLILPDGVRDGLEIVVTDDLIREVRERTTGPAIDLRGNYLAPGFIDLHVHGGAGHDAMEVSGDAFHEICRFHASGGTTSLLLTTMTAPIPEIVNVLAEVRKAAAPLRQIVGVHLEGPFISRERPGAQRPEFICDPLPAATKELLANADVIKRVTLAAELPGALQLIAELCRRGISVSGGHTDAWDEQVREAFDQGLRSSTHTFNCMSSARRRGVRRVAGFLEFAMSEPEISCELIADGHHVSATLMKLLYRAKGARGICLVTDAIAGAGLPEGTTFQLGGRQCVVENGVCLLADRSALAGSASRMIDVVRCAVTLVGIPLHEAILMATGNPARAIGLEGRKGALRTGADADFVVLSPELEVLQTYVAGEQIYPSSSS